MTQLAVAKRAISLNKPLTGLGSTMKFHDDVYSVKMLVFVSPLTHRKGLLKSPDTKIYLGLMNEIWANLGFDDAIFPIFSLF